jgi:hypothetical protein
MSEVFWTEISEQRQTALVKALGNIPAEDRQGSIAKALVAIEQRERREALLAKLRDMDTDELQRLGG